MRSRKLSPGSAVMRTTMRSERTRVPPVTAERSPPASRITGADSPVMADSSTDAMPSTMSPSPGIVSPASQTTSRRRAGRAPAPGSRWPSASSLRATVVVRVLRSASACALPRPSASASEKLANSTVSHSQMAIWSSNVTSVPPWTRSTISWPVTSAETTSTEKMTGLRAARADRASQRVDERAARTIGPSSSFGCGLHHQSLEVRASATGAERQGGEEGEGADDQDHAHQQADEDRRGGGHGRLVGRVACAARRACRRAPARGRYGEAPDGHRHAEHAVVEVGRAVSPRERGAVVVPGRGEP